MYSNLTPFAFPNNYLRNQPQVCHTASQRANTRNCLELGGVWIDEGYDTKLKTVTVKAMSAAYFRILEIQPKMRDVFRLGNHLVWVTPNGTALIIDMSTGQEEMTEAAIRELFVAPPATGTKKS